MNPTELFDKAKKAVASAQLLLSSNDFDGACNRAYYAMFDAARALLFLHKPELHAETIKTHSGLITAFSLHFVKSGIVSTELGKTLNKAEDLRLIADYTGDLITQEQASWVVAQAAIFVNTLHKL